MYGSKNSNILYKIITIFYYKNIKYEVYSNKLKLEYFIKLKINK